MDRDRVIQTLRLAEQLGAETVTLSGTTMSEEILAYARDRNVSKIVIGKPGRSLWKRIVLGSIVDALVRGSGEIDIYVVSGEQGAEPARPTRIRPDPSDWPAYGVALGVVALCTAIAWVMFRHVGLSNLIMVYLLGVVGVATRAGRGPTALASVLSVAAFDFFFVPPYLSFAVSDSEHLITFAVMLIVALVISGLTVRIRAQADSARHRERRIAALYAMSRELATTRGVDNLLETALRHIGEVFPGQLAVLLPDDSGRVVARRTSPAEFALDASELGVAQWVYAHRELAGLGTATLPGARALYLPLIGSRGAVGVLGLSPSGAAVDGEPRAAAPARDVRQPDGARHRARAARGGGAARRGPGGGRAAAELAPELGLPRPADAARHHHGGIQQPARQWRAARRRDARRAAPLHPSGGGAARSARQQPPRHDPAGSRAA